MEFVFTFNDFAHTQQSPLPLAASFLHGEGFSSQILTVTTNTQLSMDYHTVPAFPSFEFSTSYPHLRSITHLIFGVAITLGNDYYGWLFNMWFFLQKRPSQLFVCAVLAPRAETENGTLETQ